MAGLYLRSVEVYDLLLKKVPPRETVRSLWIWAPGHFFPELFRRYRRPTSVENPHCVSWMSWVENQILRGLFFGAFLPHSFAAVFFEMELGSKSGKRFSKSCPKKSSPRFSSTKNPTKPFSIRQMDENKNHTPHQPLLQVLPVTTRTKHPLDKAATWFATKKSAVARNIINWASPTLVPEVMGNVCRSHQDCSHLPTRPGVLSKRFLQEGFMSEVTLPETNMAHENPHLSW